MEFSPIPPKNGTSQEYVYGSGRKKSRGWWACGDKNAPVTPSRPQIGTTTSFAVPTCPRVRSPVAKRYRSDIDDAAPRRIDPTDFFWWKINEREPNRNHRTIFLSVG
ncbi:hypothetical protein MTP99_016201 [Tenebrio molitor]|jgi:hypothetical protein|nr:hypothetical protein MTP99_016201 [Tenebrio molitor]